MSALNIDWNGIRPLNGARSSGFEELCAQLARAECPVKSRFERKGVPDGGVECYCVLDGGAEWGWQAKYVDGLGDSQWSQIDKSVRTALEKHPRLVRYFVCVPYDRPDAGISGRKSAMDRWNDHVTRWTAEAANRGMAVAFEYWGSHELILRLSHPGHVGRIRFWFDSRAFDETWFAARLVEALKAAGPRYTPEVHVDLPVAAEFEAFGRTQTLSREIKSQALGIRDKARSFEYAKLPLIDAELETSQQKILSDVQGILSCLGLVDIPPIGDLGLSEIIDRIAQAETGIAALDEHLSRCEREFRKRPGAPGAVFSAPGRETNQFREYHMRLVDLSSELAEVKEVLIRGQRLATPNLMILSGDAGSGKTHLLCDVAKQRISKARPTVLLMGQRFIGTNDPWAQSLDQMDLAGLAIDEFVGALEAAAQAANCRALFMIDAVNEGSGRLIWPANLAPFVAQLERSPWIGIVLSVRKSYEEAIVPEALRTQALHVTHHGFVDHEYDATKVFFHYYGLELPSTPLLDPEFRNPLFLKTLCTGLRAKGETRLPRGFHGITATMELYLDAINQRLSTLFQYHPKLKLVKLSLEAVSLELLNSGKRWLPLQKAQDVVNAFLKDREFDRSLYHGLVSEGLLVEDIPRQREGAGQEVVFIAFDRFADYLTAKMLLDKYLDAGDPSFSFSAGKPLAFISEENKYVAPGLLEALCVQVPERIGRELVEIAPEIKKKRGIGDAFRRSIVWRAAAACTDTSKVILLNFLRHAEKAVDTIDVLLTVATIPGHPLNADFFDRQLRKDAMPARDGWWSIAIHKSWGRKGALDRLVDWSAALPPGVTVDGEVIDLCATSLAWTFTSSNRFLRDQATQALGNLLTSRTDAVVRMLERFWNIDDPYVLERVYAVAYSVICKCHDPSEVGKVAGVVYLKVFSTGAPPAHILLRDYAAGIVERAFFLKAPVTVPVDPKFVRPPFQSKLPEIPSEEEIKPYLPNWSSEESGKSDWARNRIGGSVMHDDFARYVIGTNSSSTSRHWLDLKLCDPAWVSPPSYENLAQDFVSVLSDAQQHAWKTLQESDQALDSARLQAYFSSWFSKPAGDAAGTPSDTDAKPSIWPTERAGGSIGIEDLEEKRSQAYKGLEDILAPQLRQRLQDLFKAKSLSREELEPPGFDLGKIQRFILKRVFELGWTTELFGEFDRFEIGYHGRGEDKAERIGKKYQWIAYHEILALLSDHYQYKESYREYEGGVSYLGPWQEDLRDIDPTCPSLKSMEDEELEAHVDSWWSPARYANWEIPANPAEWVIRVDDLPKVEEFLVASNPRDGTRWLNALSHFNWDQEVPSDKKSSDVGGRGLWYKCTGYLIPKGDAKAFLEWSKQVDFWGRWMPEEPELYQMFLGEHGWAPASVYFEKQCLRDASQGKPDKGCPNSLRLAAVEYGRSGGGLDCSVKKGFHLKLPTWGLVRGLRLKWNGNAADFLDARNRLAATDPSFYGRGPSCLLLREDLLLEYLKRENLAFCWMLLGEKRHIGPGIDPKDYFSLHISGAYIMDDSGLSGAMKFTPEARAT